MKDLARTILKFTLLNLHRYLLNHFNLLNLLSQGLRARSQLSGNLLFSGPEPSGIL